MPEIDLKLLRELNECRVTFDHSTVGKLLTALETMEAELANWRVTAINRAETAEATIQRVRDVVQKRSFDVHEAGYWADSLIEASDVLEALDGAE